MSDSIAHKLWIAQEGATFGTFVPGNPFTPIRNISCSLSITKDSYESEEAVDHRQVVDTRHGNKQGGGEIGVEFSYGSFDVLLVALFCSSGFTVKGSFSNNVNVSADTADDSYNLGAGTWPLLHAGDLVTFSGFTDPLNNGVKTVLSRTNTKLMVLENLANEAAGDNVNLTTSAEIIKAGSVLTSLTALRQFSDQTDLANSYYRFDGVRVNSFTLTVSPGGVVKGSFGLIAKDLEIGDEPVDFEADAPSTTRVFDSFTGALYEGGTKIATVTEIQLSINNGFEPNFVCFDNTMESTTIGKAKVGGSISLYFKDKTMVSKFLDETPSSLMFELTDKAGNTYKFRMPNITYTGAPLDTSAMGNIVTAMPFSAIYDPTLGTSIVLERVDA